LRAIAVAIERKGAEIWAKETNLQQVNGKSNRLLVKHFEILAFFVEFTTQEKMNCRSKAKAG
jgi:hypothetical protein